jgi:ribose transport system ATP-binding protein
MGNKTILKLEHVSKAYPGVQALDDVSVEFESGEVHALMGENGAGKSTLIKVIGGAVRPTEGKIILNGKTFSSLTPAASAQNGVGVIYQEFNLVPSLSVAENVCLGNKLGHRFLKDRREMRKAAQDVFRELGVQIDPDVMVGMLSTAQQQLVEIAKSMIRDVHILIMDEPTASLSLAETENLLAMVRALKEKGVTILYVSHRLDEVLSISDRVTVLRDGRYVDTKRTAGTGKRELVAMMVGRDIGEEYPQRETRPGETVLEVRGLCGQGDRDISFELHEGEVLGVAGLVGSGRTELAKMLYGHLPREKGEVRIHGKLVHITSPQQAIRNGIGLIPEDRKREGVFLDYSIEWNIPIMSIRGISNGLLLDRVKISDTVQRYIKRLKIAAPSPHQLVRNLSGGNQQKVALAKTLAANTDILILDEPTRGIDVGAKQEIYRLMNELAQEGIAILMISSEMEEVIGMSDRIMVFYEGRVAGTLARDRFDPKRIMALASGMGEEV